MTTTEGTKVTPKYTEERIKCTLCLYGNFFIIEAKREGSQWYYLTRCPRCSHYEDIKEISLRVAQDYIPPTELK